MDLRWFIIGVLKGVAASIATGGALLLEDGSSYLLLEDGGKILLE